MVVPFHSNYRVTCRESTEPRMLKSGEDVFVLQRVGCRICVPAELGVWETWRQFSVDASRVHAPTPCLPLSQLPFSLCVFREPRIVNSQLPLPLHREAIKHGNNQHGHDFNGHAAKTGDGQPRSELDGRSLVPFIENPAKKVERAVLTTTGEQYSGVTDGRYRYIQYRDGSEEFYDHRSDPHEWNNVVSDPEFQTVIERLKLEIPTQWHPAVKAKKKNKK